jgi:PAS domain S-box-containing protein
VLRRDDHANANGVLESNRDITAKRAAEETQWKWDEEVRQSEIRFRLLIDAVKDYAIISLDANGLVASWNSGAQRLKGYSAEEIIGQHVERLYLREDVERGKLAEELRRAAAEGHVDDEGWRVRKDGSRFWAEIVTTALRGADGELIGFVKIDKDISSRRAAEEQIQELNSQLTQRVDELGSVNRELEAFSYSVSHDLRAPLRSIDGFSKALLEDYAAKLDANGQHYLGRVRAAAQRMGELIDDLLQLSKVGRAELRRGRVDLSVLARTVATELQRVNPDGRVQVLIPDGVVADADYRLLQVVFENLLGNAWKFTTAVAEALIEFGVSQQGGVPTYFVRDNGAGFDMAYAGKLFTPFQRMHSEARFPGTGIGLATVRRIVDRHGGRVWAESAVERGATFLWTLPSSRTGGLT